MSWRLWFRGILAGYLRTLARPRSATVKKVARIILSKRQELPFVRGTLREISDHVDLAMISIPTFSHTGAPLELDFDFDEVTRGIDSGRTDVQIHLVGSRGFISNADSPKDQHHNEFLTRTAFLDEVSLSRKDVVLALDADEVPYGSSLDSVFYIASKRFIPVSLRLRQFFYRPNYLWENNVFRNTIAARVGVGQFRRIGFRDKGVAVGEGFNGCHFSWQLTPAEMVVKLGTYAHSADYKHLAMLDVLEQAVSCKTYPFEPGVDFRIRELGPDELHQILPKGMKPEMKALSHLLPQQFEEGWE
jgi:hypothetical protein